MSKTPTDTERSSVKNDVLEWMREHKRPACTQTLASRGVCTYSYAEIWQALCDLEEDDAVYLWEQAGEDKYTWKFEMVERAEKAPVGIMPRSIWLEKRARELSGAISRRVEANMYDDTLQTWIIELLGIVEEKSPNGDKTS